MITHQFWGEVEEDWAGFSAEKTFNIPQFNSKDITLFLGEEFDEEGDEIDTPPSIQELDAYEATFSGFILHLDRIIADIKEQGYMRYLKLYAHYYEDQTKSGEPPLQINDAEKHFEYLKEINYLRILNHQTIQIPIRYELDTEHGMEFRIENYKIVAIGGIATT